jgi:hypothetical protein
MQTTYDTGKAKWSYRDPIYSSGNVVRSLLGPCPTCGSITSEYGGGYSCHNEYCVHSAYNFTCDAGPKPDWWGTDILVYLDGDAWCAVGDGFQNIQESPVGFGSTPNEAVEKLRAEIAVLDAQAK